MRSKLLISKIHFLMYTGCKIFQAEDLFNHVRKGFLSLLDSEVTWMDQKTKELAREKALAIKYHIGYNSHIYGNASFINEKFQKVRNYRIIQKEVQSF